MNYWNDSNSLGPSTRKIAIRDSSSTSRSSIRMIDVKAEKTDGGLTPLNPAGGLMVTELFLVLDYK